MNESLEKGIQANKDLLYKQVNDYPVGLEEAVNILHKFGQLKALGIPSGEIEQAMDNVFFKHRDYCLKHKADD